MLLGDLLKGLDPQLDLTGFNRRVLSRGAALTNLEIVLGAVWRKSAIGMAPWLLFSLVYYGVRFPARVAQLNPAALGALAHKRRENA